MACRDDSASLRAENARLRAEFATLRARRARRWMVRPGGWWQAALAAVFTAFWIVCIVCCGWTTANAIGLGWNAAQWAMWALCFVLRVPVDGGES